MLAHIAGNVVEPSYRPPRIEVRIVTDKKNPVYNKYVWVSRMAGFGLGTLCAICSHAGLGFHTETGLHMHDIVGMATGVSSACASGR